MRGQWLSRGGLLGPRVSHKPPQLLSPSDSEELASLTETITVGNRGHSSRSLLNKHLCNNFMTRKPSKKMYTFLALPRARMLFGKDLNERGRSQDGVLGGCGVRVSAQLGHLPGPGGGPRTPKGTEGTSSDCVGCGTWGE